MRQDLLVIASVLTVLLVGPSQAADTPKPAAKSKVAGKVAVQPRTPWGHPDLQGVWDYATITPMERPSELAGKEVLTEQEAAEFEKRTLSTRDADRRDGGAQADVGRAYNQFWWDYGSKVIGTRRTSLIVEPADGRIPPMTAEGKRLTAERAVVRSRPAHGPEDRNLWERCILGGNTGPPMTPSAYNNLVQIFQTRDSVVLLNEMINDARIIPLDGRPHIPSHIRQWRGDSRGRWEGATLVVETKNCRDDTGFRNASSSLHLIEKFTRLAPDTLLYEFTVNDPNIWTKPWSAALPMSRSQGPVYEYACHEGNYGMVNLLAGARAEEKAAEAAKKK